MLSHGSSIITNGLILCLDAANPKSYPGSGSTWYDLSGNGNHGTLINGPTYNSVNKGSIVFDGSDDYVTIQHATSLEISNKTIAIWAKCRLSNPGTMRLISKRTASYTDEESGQLVIVDSDVTSGSGDRYGLFALNMSNATTGTIKVNDSVLIEKDPVTNFNMWHFIVSRIQDNNAILYIDGVLSGECSIGLQTTNTSPILIGCVNDSSLTEFWDGDISQVQIYNRALSLSEITRNFAATRGRYLI